VSTSSPLILSTSELLLTTTLGTKWAHYDAVSGRLRGDSLSTGATDTLRYLPTYDDVK
jgi:hypothetical protein